MRRLFPWAGDYLSVYERYGLTGPHAVMAHSVCTTDAELERLAARRHVSRPLPGKQRRARQRHLPVQPAPGRRRALRARHRRRRRHRIRHAQGSVAGLPDAAGRPSAASRSIRRACCFSPHGPGRRRSDSTDEIGDFQPGKAADLLYLRPPPDSTFAAVLERVDSPEQALAALFTLAGAESVQEVRVAGAVVFRRNDHARQTGVRSRSSAGSAVTIAELNACDRRRFVDALGWIFEGSPWVAERVVDATGRSARSPSCTRSMIGEVVAATRQEQLALLRAHPDLGTRASMSDASVGEQAGAGLDRLTPEEFDRLQRLTSAYREKFGFPFLLAVKGRSTPRRPARARSTSAGTPEKSGPRRWPRWAASPSGACTIWLNRYAAPDENSVPERRRARRAREGAARGVGAPQGDRAGVWGGAPRERGAEVWSSLPAGGSGATTARAM